MSKRDLLLEIGLEEVPARFIADAVQQLAEKVEKWLAAERIAFERIDTYETPRRLTVLVSGVAEKQEDVEAEFRGPALKIARDEAGNWTKAALGFARSSGVEPAQLEIKEYNGVAYVFAHKREAGKQTMSLLPGLGEVILSLHFPKNMRWGASEVKFVRPIRWLVALFGDEVVELEVAGVPSGRTSYGHRFLGSAVELAHPGEYVERLRAQYVIVDPAERREQIVGQLKRLEQERGWRIPIDSGLLDEVVHLVEYPTVVYGTFDADFLQIPREVLVTSMREHQRYFPVEDEAGNLLPHFVTVRNGDARALANVARGNEKVLKARLSDARFFYEEDQKRTIDEYLARLEHIVFHEELGTIGQKVRRIGRISEQLASRLGLDPAEAETAKRIAAIGKFDLVTQMVYEFPELQGVMGENYARLAGEPEAVARGVFEHYLPRFSGDQLPASAAAAVVSIADKLDTIVGCFAIGIIPTGSQDPYALRRQAAGIVQILLARSWPLRFAELFELALRGYQEQGVEKRPAAGVQRDLRDFFALRLKNVLQEEGIRYDVIDAVLGTELTLAHETVAKARALMAAVQTEAFKLVAEQFNRVYNLAQKAESREVDPALFSEPAERQLAEACRSVFAEAGALEQQGDMERVLAALTRLSEPIRQFFEQVMVMADDPRIRTNRLALLRHLSEQVQRYADFTKLVFA
ncbi:glycine--tRNA ligase subunit beta [Brevibacillus marinus]|uniref:glycine--tRNA ligase subunit beta n=1 Tax=Brevibacillus marinus TaxID=2496837 RepID=UPI000F838918|nr:glycine--tRNA ligase subunit beta [Brevibacillus marinus]